MRGRTGIAESSPAVGSLWDTLELMSRFADASALRVGIALLALPLALAPRLGNACSDLGKEPKTLLGEGLGYDTAAVGIDGIRNERPLVL